MSDEKVFKTGTTVFVVFESIGEINSFQIRKATVIDWCPTCGRARPKTPCRRPTYWIPVEYSSLYTSFYDHLGCKIPEEGRKADVVSHEVVFHSRVEALKYINEYFVELEGVTKIRLAAAKADVKVLEKSWRALRRVKLRWEQQAHKEKR